MLIVTRAWARRRGNPSKKEEPLEERRRVIETPDGLCSLNLSARSSTPECLPVALDAGE